MESKKINQLATELAPDLSDLTIIGDPTTGISKKITLSQMASLFTGTVEEYANFAAFPLVGVADTIYVAKDTNVIYRWDSTAYVVLSPNIIASLVFNDANGFDGNIALVGSVATLTITTALTTGSVGFIGASGALLQDNANFFWDDTNNRLGLGTNAPTTALDIFGSGIIGRINGTSTNNAYLGFASAGTNKWSVGNVQSDHRFRIFSEANSAELITILQTGEFGIGIANPTTKFHIDGAASALIANLDANVSVAKSISFRSDNSNRINLEVSGTESGSNAGANFFIRRYSDAGALIDTPLTITRSTGAISLATTLNLSEIQASTSAGITLKSNGGTSVALFGAGGGAGTTLYGGLIGTSASFSDTISITANNSTAYSLNLLGRSADNATTLNFFSNNGATRYGFIYTEPTKMEFGVNSSVRLAIASTGAATFSSSVSATKIILSGGSDQSELTNVINNDFKLTNSGNFRIINNLNSVALFSITNAGSAVFSNNVQAASMNVEAGTSASFSFGVNQQSTFAFGSTNGKRVGIIRDATAADNGLQFGYDTVEKTGIIAGAGTSAGCGIDFFTYNGSAWGNRMRVAASGSVTIYGSLSKGSGSFRIDHPLESMSKTHQLVHSFVEAPQADLYYRGKIKLINGKGQANIDEVATMTEGTFEALCREVQCFTTNESGWDLIKGKVIGNIIYIESQNTKSIDEISWLVIGERKDKHIMETDWTDENGKVIVEPLKPIKEEVPIIEEETILEEEIIENINK